MPYNRFLIETVKKTTKDESEPKWYRGQITIRRKTQRRRYTERGKQIATAAVNKGSNPCRGKPQLVSKSHKGIQKRSVSNHQQKGAPRFKSTKPAGSRSALSRTPSPFLPPTPCTERVLFACNPRPNGVVPQRRLPEPDTRSINQFHATFEVPSSKSKPNTASESQLQSRNVPSLTLSYWFPLAFSFFSLPSFFLSLSGRMLYGAYT